MKLVLQQKQQLNLVMTTELRQAITLLQYSTQDLYDYLKEQELENPLIELVEKNETYDYSKSRNQTVQSNDDYIDPLDFVANKESDLYEFLIEQIEFKKISQEKKEQLKYLILNLDENGYITFNKQDLAKDLQLDELAFESLVLKLQSLEPIGIGATDLADCLKIQLKFYYPDEILAKKIVKSYLKELANKQWHTISKQENVSMEEIDHAFEIIRSLNPKPAGNFNCVEATYLTPDIILEFDEESEQFIVNLNDHYIPNIKFNQSYTQKNNESNHFDNYVKDQFKKYQWLKNSIEQRRSTIIKIMNVLLTKQTDVFLGGLKKINPLTLKDVAEIIDMHESTVSRATDNKIIQTPAGTFELKQFFSTRLSTSTGEDTSQTQVKNILQSMIKKENKYKPLSDQKLAEQMKVDQNIVISRRTIAKYRDELNIPSSSKRKEIKI